MEPTRKKIRPLPIVLGVAAIGLAIFAFTKVRYMMTHEDTENSYLEADIIGISPKVQGYIGRVLVSENQYVKAGDTLFVLDDRDYVLRLRQAEAALHNAEANVALTTANATSAGAGVGTAAANVRTTEAGLLTTETSVQTAESNLEAALARQRQAEQDYNRYATLVAQRAVTQQQFDAQRAARESADAAVQGARSQLEAARRQVEVGRRQTAAGQSQTAAVQSQAAAASKNVSVAQTLVEQRRIELENARLNLSYTVILAPTSGFVAKKSGQIGQLANIGSPLCSIVSDKNLWITANFKETQVGEMQPGQPVNIKVDAYPGRTFNGRIESIAPATGAKFSLLPPDNASGNFVKVVQRIPVRIALTDAPNGEQPLRAGMSVEVIVPTK